MPAQKSINQRLDNDELVGKESRRADTRQLEGYFSFIDELQQRPTITNLSSRSRNLNLSSKF